MATGLKGITENQKKSGGMSGGPRARMIRIYDGENAFVRFLANGDDKDDHLQSFEVHPEQVDGRFTSIFCTSDETGLCTRCMNERAKAQFGVWLWVDRVLRKFQNPAFTEGREGSQPWKKVTWGEKDGQPEAFFVQPINDVRLLTLGPGRQGYILDQLLRSFNEYGTLMDRPYLIHREGAKLDTTYSFKALERSPLPENMLVVYNKLPSIIDVVSGKAQWPLPVSSEVTVEDGEEVEEFNPDGPPTMQQSDAIELIEDEDNEGESGVSEFVPEQSSIGDEQIMAKIDEVLGKK